MLDATDLVGPNVFSPKLDFAAFTLPIIVSVLLAPVFYAFVPPNYLPVWGYIIVVGFSDVGHVWTTIFRTHLDSEENNRLWGLYNLSPVVLFVVSVALHYINESIFWIALGYFAIYHFMKQQYGFLCLTKAHGGPDARRDWALDRRCLYGGALAPIAMWHSDATRKFDWFNRDDPLVLPLHKIPYAFEASAAVWALVAVVFLGRQALLALRGECNYRKVTFVLYSWLSWGVGTLLNHKLIALTFLNLFHAMPAFIVIFCVCKNRWQTAVPSTVGEHLVKWLCTPSRWPMYALFFMFIGLVEEALWESMVWHDYTEEIFEWDPRARYGDLGYAMVCCLLTLPQLTHYFLDAFIWKQGRGADGHELNPGLRTYMGLNRP